MSDTPAPQNQDAPSSAEDKTLDKLLAEAQARIDEHRDAWMRAVAEAENVRKRAQADVAAAHKFAVERFAESPAARDRMVASICSITSWCSLCTCALSCRPRVSP